MISIKLTNNYTGFDIEGTFDDFYELYDSIHFFLGYDECKNKFEEDMRLHILGFLYDLRHAYQGDRNIKAVDNQLSEEEKIYYGIKKNVKQNIMYNFYSIIPELLICILCFKHFSKTKEKEINMFHTEYHNVCTFFGKVIEALRSILKPSEYKKANKLLIDTDLDAKKYMRQWYNKICIDYIKMTKTRRKKELLDIIIMICNGEKMEEYQLLKKEIVKYAKEHNCPQSIIEIGNYPDEIIW